MASPFFFKKRHMDKKLIIQKMVYRGTGHADFCQDFLVEYETEHFFMGAVMDGCSEGNHSHFASSLFGKIFNKMVRHDDFFAMTNSTTEPIELIRVAMFEFAFELSKLKQELCLSDDELMSTILLAVYSKSKESLTVLAVGDGYIRVNGEGYWIVNDKFDSKDKPNYLIYDLERASSFDDSVFQGWFNELPLFHYQNVHDFSITTDGIMTFLDRKNFKQNELPIPLLLDDRVQCGGMSNPSTLRRKMTLLARPYEPEKGINGMDIRNYDDLSIIRVIVETQEQ
jgi:hypothetical protein